MTARSKEPGDLHFVSKLYHEQTRRPGYIFNQVKRDEGGKRVEQWVAVVPLKDAPALNRYTNFETRQQAADAVVIWRCMNGMDEKGVEQ